VTTTAGQAPATTGTTAAVRSRVDLFVPSLLVYALTAFWILVLPGAAGLPTRALNVALVLAAMAVLGDLATRLFTRRAGLTASASFGFAAPVLYVGAMSANVGLLLALAVVMHLAVTRRELWTAVPIGGLGGAVAAVQPLTQPLLLPLAVLAALPPGVARARRAAAAVIVGSAVFATQESWLQRPGIAVVRERLIAESVSNPIAPGSLIRITPHEIWSVAVAAVAGLVFVLHTRRDLATPMVGLVALATTLPLLSGWSGEVTLFHSQLAYTALFLAPLAGWGLARPWRTAVWTPALFFLLTVSCVWGVMRAHDVLV
jgi:hypothetical protein